MEVFELDKDRFWKMALDKFDATFYHGLAWKKVIEDVYGFEPIYLLAEEDDIVGLLPTFLIRNLMGKRLISLPFSPYGGVLANDNRVERELIYKALEIEKRLELRCFGNSDHLCTFLLELGDVDSVWSRIGKKVRNSTRKAKRLGLSFAIEDRLEEFYDMYSRNMHSLGSPTHPIEFFERLLDLDCVDMGVVIKGERVVAGSILLKFKDTVISGWAGSDKRYLKMCPNNLLYWGCIRHACMEGFRYFDFGRSLVGSGTFKFKKAWGGRQIGLNYRYYPKKGVDTSMRNPMRRTFANFWRKIPYRVARTVSPALRGLFP